MQPLDTTDLRLLLALAEDSTRTAVALAAVLGLSRNTVQARLAGLERKGAFLPFERRISTAALGYPLMAFVHVHVHQPSLARITEDLAGLPEVVEAHGLTGDADILLRVVAADAEDLFRINKQILAVEGVQRCDTNLAMGELIPLRAAPLLRRGAGLPQPPSSSPERREQAPATAKAGPA
ncbi:MULTISPECIES: Lrp/AsnC family transcriptional regulator [unclassified Arthrobacter]|uniref:Lrp/AsnC family transcriptional regulator n=1 Tax=unclassified Arthrobacter TaxID=235627 RepID=UPI001D157514|nr:MULTISPECIES: Lrp/AsnC family transcriptional regulator [unclassified Arthrobacter]MCC3292692.1 Lrp/AsnC family transcriptional regulator [Arthrobacter sp. zg-Y1110]MCC3303069.1 Lrp/AsnC family transcriptional regulator [Arthrobacter sp. zg-Y895]UWX85975.1 Lrp/AsnC family transcriptional regulator [Arthrobacter sp. zg-Y1110]